VPHGLNKPFPDHVIDHPRREDIANSSVPFESTVLPTITSSLIFAIRTDMSDIFES